VINFQCSSMPQIVEFLKKHWFLLLSFLYFLTRLFNLLTLPIFNDEAIYIDWANKMRFGYVPTFYSLYDGKPPLHFILISQALKVFANPLLAGRLVSVFIGFSTLIVLKKISEAVFDKREGVFLVCVFYILSPIYTFFDRQALQEPVLTTFLLWSFYFLIKYSQKFRVKDIIFSALFLNLAFFTKASAAYLLGPICLYFIYKFFVDPKNRNNIFLSAVCYFCVFICLLAPLMLQEQAHLIFTRNDRYLLSLNLPPAVFLKILIDNLVKSFHLFLWYFNVYLLFFVISLVSFLRKVRSSELKIFFLFMLPLIIMIFTSKEINDRYIAPFSIFLIFICAAGFTAVNNSLRIFFYFTLIVPALITFFQIININSYISLLNKSYPHLGLSIYQNGFTSGYGVTHAITYLQSLESSHRKLYLGVRVDAGNPESAVMAYFLKDKKATVVPMYFDARLIKLPLPDDFVGNIYPFYFISRDDNLAGMDKYLTLVKKFFKPDGVSFVGIYKYQKSKS